ncbi:uncharacterized protein LOC129765771 [Toxorhynchites rutilus septentrionalis]|uniref:uncharacterized protein LOC129765771 n=1 Tax=Toxorhynchites rutilus septentrionalis TaxID=329112 RepID=UPI00247A5DDA|nr:uncharacterized protein LOC129765771 [Toxorhynchites rutilus septentrionalis]
MFLVRLDCRPLLVAITILCLDDVRREPCLTDPGMDERSSMELRQGDGEPSRSRVTRSLAEGLCQPSTLVSWSCLVIAAGPTLEQSHTRRADQAFRFPAVRSVAEAQIVSCYNLKLCMQNEHSDAADDDYGADDYDVCGRNGRNGLVRILRINGRTLGRLPGRATVTAKCMPRDGVVYSEKGGPISKEEYAAKSDNVGYEACIEFLYQRIRILQTVSTEIQHRSQAAPTKVAGPHSFSKKLPTTKAVANSATASSRPSPPSCIACPEKHLLFQCSAFQRMTVEQRRELISQKRLCWNCFKSSHIARRCDSKYTCRHCHERHHTLLHKSSSDPAAQSTPQYPTQQANSHGSGILVPEVSVPAHSSSPSTVFLSTVSLWIEDRFGRQHSARALIDSGSQSNFISKKLARRLCLQSDRVRVPIAGIGETTVTVTQSVISTIHSKNNEFSSKLEFLVLPNPTSELPTSNVDISMWKIPSNFPLADPAFNVSSPIDLLLGIEQFHEYIMSGRIILGKGCPVLFETVFGWAVIGRCYGTTPPTTPVCHIATTRNLESLLERFWELESLQSDRIYSAKEIACEELYQGTTTRKSDGRYVVSLPKSQDPYIQLGESRAIAERRLLCLERKLERDASVKEAYHEFLEEYSRLGHMRRLEDPVDNSIYHYYLPHHPVFKASSTTTKVRVVFDASCRTSSGSSLNDLLLVGPIVQEDLQSIKLRFRTKPIGLVADIEKMFRQIAVCRNDQPLLSFRPLPTLATDEGENFPMAKKAVLEDFYVDDLISGASTPEEAVELRRQLSAMLQSAGFPLRKWASNSSAVLAEIPSEELAIQPVYESADEQSRWWTGPAWLKQTKKHWPSQLVDSVASSKAVVEECKVCLAALISPTDQLCDWLFNCFSSYTKLRKAVAYFLRYMGVLHATAAKKHPDGACAASSKTPCEPHTHLTASDLQDAEHVLCQLSQRETFPTELKALRNGRPVDKTSPMKFFNPMLSKDGLIKVGGRIQDSNSPEIQSSSRVNTDWHTCLLITTTEL